MHSSCAARIPICIPRVRGVHSTNAAPCVRALRACAFPVWGAHCAFTSPVRAFRYAFLVCGAHSDMHSSCAARIPMCISRVRRAFRYAFLVCGAHSDMHSSCAARIPICIPRVLREFSTNAYPVCGQVRGRRGGPAKDEVQPSGPLRGGRAVRGELRRALRDAGACTAHEECISECAPHTRNAYRNARRTRGMHIACADVRLSRACCIFLCLCLCVLPCGPPSGCVRVRSCAGVGMPFGTLLLLCAAPRAQEPGARPATFGYAYSRVRECISPCVRGAGAWRAAGPVAASARHVRPALPADAGAGGDGSARCARRRRRAGGGCARGPARRGEVHARRGRVPGARGREPGARSRAHGDTHSRTRLYAYQNVAARAWRYAFAYAAICISECGRARARAWRCAFAYAAMCMSACARGRVPGLTREPCAVPRGGGGRAAQRHERRGAFAVRRGGCLPRLAVLALLRFGFSGGSFGS